MSCATNVVCRCNVTIGAGLTLTGTGQPQSPWVLGTTANEPFFPLGQAFNQDSVGIGGLLGVAAAASTVTAPATTSGADVVIGTAAVTMNIANIPEGARLVSFLFGANLAAIAIAATPNDWTVLHETVITVNAVTVYSVRHKLVRAQVGASPLSPAPSVRGTPYHQIRRDIFVPANQLAAATSRLYYNTAIFTANAANFIECPSRSVNASAIMVHA